jgi:hypothetical protein
MRHKIVAVTMTRNDVASKRNRHAPLISWHAFALTLLVLIRGKALLVRGDHRAVRSGLPHDHTSDAMAKAV